MQMSHVARKSGAGGFLSRVANSAANSNFKVATDETRRMELTRIQSITNIQRPADKSFNGNRWRKMEP